MTKTGLIIIFHMAIMISESFGQTNGLTPFYLSSYTFSSAKDQKGNVRLRDTEGAIKTVSVAGKYAKALRLNKDHTFSIIQEKMKPGMPWVDVELQVKTSGGSFKDIVRIVNDDFIRNKVIAHRGAWKNTGATENSIGALKQAISMGCEGSEFDVHMSSDSVLFIHHDAAVNGVSIAKSNSNVLKALKLSNGESLPTLEDYLKTGIQQNKTKLILEIKMSELGKQSSLALTDKVVQMVENLKAQGWVDYISFDYDICKRLMNIAPYAKVSYLNGDKSPAELKQEAFYGLDYHFTVLQKKPEWIKEAQQNNLTVNVWTVNDKSMMEELLQKGVDFITTNEPEQLLQLIGTKKL